MAVGITTKVTCPKCHESFDYTFIPGGSLRAVRLGRYRYMKCQKCKRWALFDITSGLEEKTRDRLGNADIFAGIALVIIGDALIAVNLHRILVLYVVSLILFIVALFLVVHGFALKKPKV